jgi:peptidoglycan biosynthesis protein MviN/MurJ (putative lipid II flippase)
MKTAALIANIGLLVTMVLYLVRIPNLQTDGLGLLVIVLSFATPILSILALVTRRAADAGSKQRTDAARPTGQG